MTDIQLACAIEWLQHIAADGLSPEYGRWQPEALDCLALLRCEPCLRPAFGELEIQLRVSRFLAWAEKSQEVPDGAFARILKRELKCKESH